VGRGPVTHTTYTRISVSPFAPTVQYPHGLAQAVVFFKRAALTVFAEIISIGQVRASTVPRTLGDIYSVFHTRGLHLPGCPYWPSGLGTCYFTTRDQMSEMDSCSERERGEISG
jgi:hypothetical protein